MLRTFRYEKIADDLRQQIGHGTFDHQKLPSERVLMAHYGVHRNTVRRALSLLSAEGRISTSGKRGSFVSQTGSGPSRHGDSLSVSGTILVVTPWNEVSTALESLLRGLTRSLGESKLSLLYFDSRPKPGKARNELPDTDYLRANDIKGIVLWPQSPADVQSLNSLREFAPLVLVDRQVSGFETHSVVFDDFSGGQAVTQHLLDIGHRRIGFLTDEVFAETVQQRWRGYVQALENAGIAAEETCYGLFEGLNSPNYTTQMRLLLGGGGQPLSAVVCSNDTVALDFLNFLRRENRRVPEEVAVTGFGNLLPNSMQAMGLTTVLQPFEEAGQAVGTILLSQVTSPSYPRSQTEYVHVTIPVKLVARASSGEDELPS